MLHQYRAMCNRVSSRSHEARFGNICRTNLKMTDQEVGSSMHDKCNYCSFLDGPCVDN